MVILCQYTTYQFAAKEIFGRNNIVRIIPKKIIIFFEYLCIILPPQLSQKAEAFLKISGDNVNGDINFLLNSSLLR